MTSSRHREAFADRHIGPDDDEIAAMLAAIGVTSLDELLTQAVPDNIREDAPLSLGAGTTETEVIERLRAITSRNEVFTSLIGTGYHGTITPPVIRRNLLESPAWYTAYTPYQPEISQGRLEALFNFQTAVADLTGLELANASMLDEATAAAEAMTLLHRVGRGDGDVFLVDVDCHPQTRAVIETRAQPLGLQVRDLDLDADDPGPLDDVFGALVHYPASSGQIRAIGPLIDALHEAGVLVAVATDLLTLTLLTPPGELGADVAVGSAQRFGVPMAFGGPHAGFLATHADHRRSLPGRLVGLSVDDAGRPALRLALQTREQHIRRERATSNICTAQVLLANIAGLYACWHGPDGLAAIAQRIHDHTRLLAAQLVANDVEVVTSAFFDTITVRVPRRAGAIAAAARERRINLRLVDDDTLGISLDETTTPDVVEGVIEAFGATIAVHHSGLADPVIPASLARRSPYLTNEVFRRHRSETQMLRYLRELADRDIALDRSMIPLGSCTMKLNATTEMEPISWPELADIHPHAPAEQVSGYLELIAELESMLVDITGYDAVSLQPNAGSQGELAGLLAIRAYHYDRGDTDRDVCLIPSSAHGTNAASAVMAGMQVVVVECDDRGDIDVADLTARADEHAERLAALMITYPSTHGVFEAAIEEICAVVHDRGGQVYLDGANLNAMVGVARPGRFGADVSHLNLHKTFCIPHGGGGPGVGPIGVGAHLAPYMPADPMAEGPTAVGPVSAAAHGSAGILAISWTYIALMGAEGLRRATAVAILNANYVAARLKGAFPILYVGPNERVAHECIVDVRPARDAGVSVDDIAKRLIDYGFHAPTMSFPVAGTLMVEPTESESKAELDRFCDSMLAIADEITRVAAGEWPADDNPLVRAPHTAEDATADDWRRAYARALAVYPRPDQRQVKYWPPVSRIDGAHGDKNLVCACPDVDVYR